MIVNISKNSVLVSKHKLVTGFLAQGLGLMFRKRLVDEGWVFVFNKLGVWSVTNLFVFQSIDVIWLDEKRRVLKVTTVKPFTLHVTGAENSKFFIELPAGTASGVDVGDIIFWK